MMNHWPRRLTEKWPEYRARRNGFKGAGTGTVSESRAWANLLRRLVEGVSPRLIRKAKWPSISDPFRRYSVLYILSPKTKGARSAHWKRRERTE